MLLLSVRISSESNVRSFLHVLQVERAPAPLSLVGAHETAAQKRRVRRGVKRDLISVKRDLISVKRDLISVKRDRCTRCYEILVRPALHDESCLFRQGASHHVTSLSFHPPPHMASHHVTSRSLRAFLCAPKGTSAGQNYYLGIPARRMQWGRATLKINTQHTPRGDPSDSVTISVKRELNSVKRDLISVKRDLLSRK
jgi:hypothetical protein